jgi:hypothetical protein
MNKAQCFAILPQAFSKPRRCLTTPLVTGKRVLAPGIPHDDWAEDRGMLSPAE